MAKPRAHPAQIAFAFDPPQPATLPAALAGMDARIARVVAEALKDDARDRAIIAAEMSLLLDDEVSAHMLNGYASPAREGVNISFARMLALIAVTHRFDLLDRELREIGASVLVGEDLYLAELGNLDRQEAELKKRRQQLRAVARPIGGAKHK